MGVGVVRVGDSIEQENKQKPKTVIGTKEGKGVTKA